jgi:hypothetical protein
MDSKWRWIVPWGVLGVVGAVVAILCSTPWICESIERNTFYEFKLRLAGNATSSLSEATTIRIDDALKVHMGDTVFDISFPELRESDRWWETEPMWRRKVRDSIRREFKNLPTAGMIVIRVDPQVQLETIAVIWTSIEAVSKADLYLDVNGTEQSGVD